MTDKLAFKSFAEGRVVLFDGGMGTFIQSLELPKSAWGDYEGCNEALCLTSPDSITEIHRRYFLAGADVAESNTFGANRLVLREYGLEDKVEEINIAAVNCVKEAMKGMNNKYIALSVGPGSLLPTLSQVSYDELYDAYCEQVSAGLKAGVDLVIIETCQDLLQIKAAVRATKDMAEIKNIDLPIIVSFTVEESGTLLVGTDIATVATVLSSCDIYCLGVNCGFGPDKMPKPIAELAKVWEGRLYLSANAGMPQFIDGKLKYTLGAESFARLTEDISKQYNLSIIGGCCGTNDSHIAALRKVADNLPSSNREEAKPRAGYISSAYLTSSLRQNPAPALIGERANATGSKAFRELLLAEDFGGMAQMAGSQQDASHIIDISVAYSGRDEKKDMDRIVPFLNRDLSLPIMIDSTSVEVIESALKRITGKPLINSVNFEDGGEKLHQIFNLVKKYPAMVVGLTIDETGMAQTADKKVEIAERIYQTWVSYGFAPEDLLIDFLTFSVASGEDSKYAALATLKAIEFFKKYHPEVNTVLGVSNVSFGLSLKSRAVLNSVFLDRAVNVGLDAAIVHAEKVMPLANLEEDAVKVSIKVIDGEEGALDQFIEYFAGKAEVVVEKEAQNPEEALKSKVMKGDKTALEPILMELLKNISAMDILNDLLLPTMGKVGDLFGEGKLLLPFVLKSAEVMKECSNILTPYLQSSSSVEKETIVLATVKGDVHDIGKNLVDIILSGNGYKVINIGTKVPGEEIISAARENRAAAIGMSGLLVRSVEIMRENIAMIRDADLDVKILLGGAALSRDYVVRECSAIMPGKVYYCKDAFDGIYSLSGKMQPTDTYEKSSIPNIKAWEISKFNKKLSSTFLGNKRLSVNIKDVYQYIRKISLFEGRWGYKRDAIEAQRLLEEMLKEMKEKKIVSPEIAYGFFKTEVDGEKIYLYGKKKILLSEFPLIEHKTSLAGLYKTENDYSIMPLQLVTLGERVSDFMEELYKSNEYSKYYMYHGLFVELTEALASFCQEKLRSEIFIDGKEVKKLKRYSFGYPLCPDLAGNKIICDLLDVAEIGVDISETYQITPMYTTCAFVSWHPDSKY